jgi:3-oxoacyl-[acyl-carrier protein] reductase
MSEAAATRRVALVTGASRNIGRAIALALAEEGVAVALNARASLDALEGVAAEIAARGGSAAAFLADVADEAAVERMVDAVVRRFGRLDILVNNAAIRPRGALETLTLAEFRAVTAVILDGAFLCARAALPYLKRGEQASIVNIGGLTGHIGATGRLHVVAGKAGLVGLTKGLAQELAPFGITVNCVVPAPSTRCAPRARSRAVMPGIRRSSAARAAARRSRRWCAISRDRRRATSPGRRSTSTVAPTWREAHRRRGHHYTLLTWLFSAAAR